jgi:hypothetical protein
MAIVQIFVAIVIFFATLLSSSGGSEVDCTAVDNMDGCGPAWTVVEVGEVTGVIVPDTSAALFGIASDAYWTPSIVEIELAEAAILNEQGELDHVRQYAGVTEDGDQKVFVNGFCDDFGIDWQSEVVLVDDGGDCFFSALYNVDTDELEYFSFNGEG